MITKLEVGVVSESQKLSEIEGQSLWLFSSIGHFVVPSSRLPSFAMNETQIAIDSKS